MKMPGSNPPENGFYTFEDSPYIFEGTEPNENGEQVNNGDGFNQQTGENDFSEYLWMEHMEEFDREVMKKLEEEALMEECIEAMLDDERFSGPSNQQSNNDANHAASMLDNLQLNSVETAKNSTLNPLAAEFVPAKNVETAGMPTKSA